MNPAPLLLCTLMSDVLQAIVRLSCDGMHSKNTDAAASAQDTATALRLTCRTLRAAVDATVTHTVAHPCQLISSRHRTSSSAVSWCARYIPDGLPAHRHGLSPTAHRIFDVCICCGHLAGLQRVYLHVPKGTTKVTIMPEQMPRLNDIRCALWCFAKSDVAACICVSCCAAVPHMV